MRWALIKWWSRVRRFPLTLCFWRSHAFRIGYNIYYAPRWVVWISPGMARAYSDWRKF